MHKEAIHVGICCQLVCGFILVSEGNIKRESERHTFELKCRRTQHTG